MRPGGFRVQCSVLVSGWELDPVMRPGGFESWDGVLVSARDLSAFLSAFISALRCIQK